MIFPCPGRIHFSGVSSTTITLCLLESFQIMLMISLTRNNTLQWSVRLTKCVVRMISPPSLRKTDDSQNGEKVVHPLLHSAWDIVFKGFCHSFGIEPSSSFACAITSGVLRRDIGKFPNRAGCSLETYVRSFSLLIWL